MRHLFRNTIAELQIWLSIALLAAFVVEIGAAVAIPVMLFGGVIGWATGLAAGAAVANATRRPIGTLVGRMVDYRA
jgi:hypothetical protein